MKRKFKKLLSKTNVVGVIASEADLWLAIDHPEGIDMFELRVDKYTPDKRLLRKLERPLIITARCVEEGGYAPRDPRKRIALYLRYLEFAMFIDIEASTAIRLTGLIEKARKRGIGIIISQHVLKGPFEAPDTWSAAMACRIVQGDIFKAALKTDSLDELGRFASCMSTIARTYSVGIAGMAIGKSLGKLSRLIFGTTGSVLVYGSLDQAVVEGQWRAVEIKEMLAKVNA
ncbi:MAG: type I 3-dehydroquinate dehydratase [Patescibacteria group bacterium]